MPGDSRSVRERACRAARPARSRSAAVARPLRRNPCGSRCSRSCRPCSGRCRASALPIGRPTTGEQFGFKAVASGGSGTVDGTYTGGGYGYDGNNGADTVATHDAPDSTTYSITYIANVDAETEAGAYSTALTFVGTANY